MILGKKLGAAGARAHCEIHHIGQCANLHRAHIKRVSGDAIDESHRANGAGRMPAHLAVF